MKKTIFNVYVVMESQEQCDRMKQVCIDNGLDYWKELSNPYYPFKFESEEYNPVFEWNNEFGIWNGGGEPSFTQVPEKQFMNLLKEYKDGK